MKAILSAPITLKELKDDLKGMAPKIIPDPNSIITKKIKNKK